MLGAPEARFARRGFPGLFQPPKRGAATRHDGLFCASVAARVLHQVAFDSCGMRAAGVPALGEKGKTCSSVSPHSSTSDSVFCEHLLGLGREAGDQVGAEHDVRPQLPRRGAEADRVGARMPPLHALQDHVVAGLQREMQMRHQPLLLAERAHQLVVGLDGIDRGEAQARQLAHMLQDRCAPARRGAGAREGRRPRR